MNNYTFFIAEADMRPVTQQPHGDRKGMAPCERVSVLDKHNANIEGIFKQCTTGLEFLQTQLQ